MPLADACAGDCRYLHADNPPPSVVAELLDRILLLHVLAGFRPYSLGRRASLSLPQRIDEIDVGARGALDRTIREVCRDPFTPTVSLAGIVVTPQPLLGSVDPVPTPLLLSRFDLVPAVVDILTLCVLHEPVCRTYLSPAHIYQAVQFVMKLVVRSEQTGLAHDTAPRVSRVINNLSGSRERSPGHTSVASEPIEVTLRDR